MSIASWQSALDSAYNLRLVHPPCHSTVGGNTMNYKNLDLKIDQFIAYVNDNKINLIPPFQRGHVWRPITRRKLIENIVRGRPIPAIFLYREASGEKYEYNILDGKQRLESLMLFVGNARGSFKVADLHKYFFDKKMKEQVNFPIVIDGQKKRLAELDDQLLRDFRDYVIPTIEITLSDDNPAALDEMIDLFVDINSYGVQVKRFDIVKAMSKDLLLKDAFGLIAEKQTRGKDVYYRAKNNEFTSTLKRLQIVENLQDPNSKVDRMWELIVEVILFLRTKRHRTPIEILKSFIKAKGAPVSEGRVSAGERSELRRVFRFLRTAYRNESLKMSRLATNQIHFYSMITAIIADDLMGQYSEHDLVRKLEDVGKIIDGDTRAPKKLAETIRKYQELSAKHTTHPGRRTDRQGYFVAAIHAL